MQIEEARSLVTGAASGLGYQFALELSRAGAAVAAVDVDADGLRRLAAETAALTDAWRHWWATSPTRRW